MATISVANYTLIDPAPYASLVQTTTAGNTSITVDNAENFTEDFVLIDYLTGAAEILEVSGLSGDTINLAGSTSYAHNYQTRVYSVPFDQIELNHTSERGGSLTQLAVVDIDPTEEVTTYTDHSNSTGFALFRFVNSAAGSQSNKKYSPYSAEIAYGYEKNAAGKIAERVANRMNEHLEEFFTYQGVFELINECEETVKHERSLGWPFFYKTKHKLGRLDEGQWQLSLPSDISNDTDTNAIYSVTLGRNGRPTRHALNGNNGLWAVDGRDFWEWVYEYGITTLASSSSSGDTTLDLTDATDFPASGNGIIEGDTIQWTGKNGNTLTGVTGLDNAHSSNVTVFTDDPKGTPRSFTVENGTLYLWPPLSSTDAPTSVYITYDTAPGLITTAADKTEIPDIALVEYYVQARMLEMRDADGSPSKASSALWDRYTYRLSRLKSQYSAPVRHKLRPVRNRFMTPLSFNRMEKNIDRYQKNK
jgi:hypothetical protein